MEDVTGEELNLETSSVVASSRTSSSSRSQYESITSSTALIMSSSSSAVCAWTESLEMFVSPDWSPEYTLARVSLTELLPVAMLLRSVPLVSTKLDDAYVHPER
jgi:hypothetical protein